LLDEQVEFQKKLSMAMAMLDGEQELKRSQAEMIYDVLDMLRYQRSAKITHIMYKVNINCLILRELLGTLQRHGYVKVESRIIHPLSKNKPRGTKHLNLSQYSLTVEGLEFCKTLQTTMNALNNLIETCERERYIADAEKMKTSTNPPLMED
jgi:predicted transcriptional regulator